MRDTIALIFDAADVDVPVAIATSLSVERMGKT